jgi:predicted nucleic acid-binding protein
MDRFGRGERESITLAASVMADVLLIDDRAAKDFATRVVNIATSGTIGVLYRAAADDLIPFTAVDFDESVKRLLETNFRHTRTLLKSIHDLSRKLHGRPEPQ